MATQHHHHHTAAAAAAAMQTETIGDNIIQSSKSDTMISQRFDYRWRRLSGVDNIVASEQQQQQQQQQRRHKKLHHHHRQQQQQQQVADLKRNNELQFVKLNTGTRVGVALIKQESDTKRMAEPIDSTSELIDLELARLNNLKLSDDLNYSGSGSQQQPFIIAHPRDQHDHNHQSETMIITNNNINNQPHQQQQQKMDQHKQSTQQAVSMEATGVLDERPLLVVGVPGRLGGDHQHNNRHNLNMHPGSQHQALEPRHFDLAAGNNYYLNASGGHLTSDNYNGTTSGDADGVGATVYSGQDVQQQQHSSLYTSRQPVHQHQQLDRGYHSAHENYQSTLNGNHHHRSLDDNNYHDEGDHMNNKVTFNQSWQIVNDSDHFRNGDSFGLNAQQQLLRPAQVDYVDLDGIKSNAKQQQHQQVLLVDRNKAMSPVYLPESVIRVNSQAIQQPAAAAASSSAHEQFNESGQYSNSFVARHVERSVQHAQYCNSSGGSSSNGGRADKLVSPTAHRQLLNSSIDDDRYEHAHQQHHQHQLTALNSVPSSVKLNNNHKQLLPLDAHNYHQFASSSINSTYSNQNEDESHSNLTKSHSSQGPLSRQRPALGSDHNGPRQHQQRTQLLLTASSPLVFDDSHEVIVVQGHEQLSSSGQYHGPTSLLPPPPPPLMQHNPTWAAGAANYARLECSQQQQQQQHHLQRQHHELDSVDEDELYNQSRGDNHSSGRSCNLIGSHQGEPMDEFKVCEWYDCGNTFLDMDEFVRHLEMKHVNQEPQEKNRYFCLWANCKRNNQEFNARYKLLIHMRVHSGEKPYSCQSSNCKKSFSRLENLKIHVRSHTGEKPYKCNYDNCSKSFTNSSDRIKHHKTHKDPKPYNCTYDGCTKRYTDPSSLRKHLRAHKRQYDGPSSVADNIMSGSSQFDEYNQSRNDEHMNSSHNSSGQQGDQYHAATVDQQQRLLDSSSASASMTYHHRAHDGQHLTTDYDPTKEFESAFMESGVYGQPAHTTAPDENLNRSTGGAVPEFLDLDLQQHQQHQHRQQQHPQQQRLVGIRKKFSDPSAGLIVSSSRPGQSGTGHNSNKNLRINELRHQQLSRSWCVGGSAQSLRTTTSAANIHAMPSFQPQTLDGQQDYQHQADSNSARQFAPTESSQQWASSAASRSSNQLSSFANNNHQLQQVGDNCWQQQQQQPVRVQQHEQLMRSMPAGPVGARLSDSFFSDDTNLRSGTSSHHQGLDWYDL